MSENSEKYIITSNPLFYKKFINRAIGLIASLTIALSIFIYGLNNKPFVDLFSLIVSFFGFLLFFIILIDTTRLKVVKISQNYLLVKPIIGKGIRIDRKELVSFYELNFEVEKESKVEIWDELMLFTVSNGIKISSKTHPNYNQLKELITENLPEFNNEEIYNKRKGLNKHLVSAVLFCLLGIAFLLFPLIRLFYIKHIQSDINYNESIELKGTINQFIISTSRRNNSRTGVDIRLREHPDFLFMFNKDDFRDSERYNEFKNNLSNGESISFYMSLDEYKKKISRELPIKFIDRYFNFNIIRPYKVEYRGGRWSIGYVPYSHKTKPIQLTDFNGLIFLLLVIVFANCMYFSFRSWKQYKKSLNE